MRSLCYAYLCPAVFLGFLGRLLEGGPKKDFSKAYAVHMEYIPYGSTKTADALLSRARICLKHVF